MSPSKRLPPHAAPVRTYQELTQYAAAFAQGHLNLLLIFGPPGVGKTRAVRQALTGPVCWIGGQATPLGIYLLAYEHRHQPIVLDDVDGLYADRNGIRLLKALCQTEKQKTLGWHTEAAVLQRLDIPHQFTTTSRLALVEEAKRRDDMYARMAARAEAFISLLQNLQHLRCGELLLQIARGVIHELNVVLQMISLAEAAHANVEESGGNGTRLDVIHEIPKQTI